MSFRGLPARPRKVVRRPNKYPGAGIPGSIRMPGRLVVFIDSAISSRSTWAGSPKKPQLPYEEIIDILTARPVHVWGRVRHTRVLELNSHEIVGF